MLGITQTATRAPFGQRSARPVDDRRIVEAAVRRRDAATAAARLCAALLPRARLARHAAFLRLARHVILPMVVRVGCGSR